MINGTSIPVTANPYAKDTTGEKRWTFDRWQTTTKDGVETHRIIATCSPIAQNWMDARKQAMVRLGCEASDLTLRGWEPVGIKRVYIAHRLNADTREGIEANRARASRWVAWAARQGVSPCATWIVLTGQWDETEENRALGLKLDCAELATCDEIWLCGDGLSTGMGIESTHGASVGVPSVEKYTDDGEPPR